MPDSRTLPSSRPDGYLATASVPGVEASASGVSWGAILAGAAGAAALSLVLMLLGSGLGMSSISPWSNRGAGAAAFGFAAISWLTFTQLAASGLGGYLAGRLRTKWAGVHGDEVYFRDTAHGFLAWTVATLLTASVLTSAVGSILGAGAQAGSAMAGGAATAATGAAVAGATDASDSSGPMAYLIDGLFRRDPATTGNAPVDQPAGTTAGAPASARAETDRSQATTEITRIFANGMRTGALPPEDARYMAGVVAQRTGLSQQDAEKRVTETFSKAQTALNDAKVKAQQAADAARKATAIASLWLVISLLVGAFVASLAAVYGGRRRDL